MTSNEAIAYAVTSKQRLNTPKDLIRVIAEEMFLLLDERTDQEAVESMYGVLK